MVIALIRSLRLKIITGFFTLAISQSAAAITIDIGTGASGSYDCTMGCMQTYQQSYDSSLFGTEAVTISQLSLYSWMPTNSYGTFDVFFSYTNDYSALTTNLESNISQAWSSFASIDLSTLSAEDAVLDINGSFDYDPLMGDLIVGFYRTSDSASGGFFASHGQPWSRAYEWPSGSITTHNGYALNSTFITNPVGNVPEPSSMILLALGLAGLGFKKKS